MGYKWINISTTDCSVTLGQLSITWWDISINHHISVTDHSVKLGHSVMLCYIVGELHWITLTLFNRGSEHTSNIRVAEVQSGREVRTSNRWTGPAGSGAGSPRRMVFENRFEPWTEMFNMELIWEGFDLPDVPTLLHTDLLIFVDTSKPLWIVGIG